MKRQMLYFLVSFLMVSGVFAQQEMPNFGGSTSSAAPSSSSSDNTPPRSIIYNEVMQDNPAADFTVADYMIRPHLIGNQQFIVANGTAPSLYMGTFAMQMMGLSVFANVTQASGLNKIRAGVNMDGTLGVGLLYHFNKITSTVEALDKTSSNTTETVTKTTGAGSKYGAFGSLGLGDFSVYGEVSRETVPLNSVKTEIDNPPGVDDVSNKNLNNSTSIMGGIIKDTEGQGDHAFGAQVDLSFHKAKSTGITPSRDSSGTNIKIKAFHGLPIRLTDDLAVYVGISNTLMLSSYKNKTADLEGSLIQNTLVPNLSFRKDLGKSFEVSLGASFNLLDYTRTKSTVENTTAKQEATETNPNTLVVNGGDFSAGLRWTKGTFAIEGRINETFLTNGPYLVSGAGGPLYAHMGMTLAF